MEPFDNDIINGKALEAVSPHDLQIQYSFLSCSPLLCQYVVNLGFIFSMCENSLRIKLRNSSAFLQMTLKGSVWLDFHILACIIHISIIKISFQLCCYAGLPCCCCCCCCVCALDALIFFFYLECLYHRLLSDRLFK